MGSKKVTVKQDRNKTTLRQLNQTAQTQVLLDNNVCGQWLVEAVIAGEVRKGNVPLTAAMTKRICVVSVAQVK